MNQAWLRALEIELQRQALISLLVLIVLFAVTMWVLYVVIKAAIRDGIRESGLLEMRRTGRPSIQAAVVPESVPTMPDMRAER
ncbi:MAG: hypothetical protein AB7I35_14125 [Ramlibacter sp.]